MLVPIIKPKQLINTAATGFDHVINKIIETLCSFVLLSQAETAQKQQQQILKMFFL